MGYIEDMERISVEDRSDKAPSIFESVTLSDAQKIQIDMIRHCFKVLYLNLNALLDNGRYKSLAMTSIEEACMWAVKSVTHEVKLNFDVSED